MINIQKPKKAQLNRIMKGCGIRIVEGDYPIKIKPELIRKIKNSFNKGKAHTIYSDDIEGQGLSEMYDKAKEVVKREVRQTGRQLKKKVNTEVRQTARQLKKEAINAGNELKQEAIKTGNQFVRNVAKPYLKEMVQTGILGLGGAAALVQPELAPFIGMATLGAEAYANSFIDNLGRPRPRPKPVLDEDDKEVDTDYGDEFICPVPEQTPQLFNSVMSDRTSSQQGLIGYGINYSKRGNGLFAGGGLVTQDRTLHPALQSSNPVFYLNRNILPSFIQNQMYS